MPELFIMAVVVPAFVRRAAERNLPRLLWGLTGALSYFGPVMAMRFLILPHLLRREVVIIGDALDFRLFGGAASLLFGVLCCFVVYLLLLRRPLPASVVSRPDLLDDHLTR